MEGGGGGIILLLSCWLLLLASVISVSGLVTDISDKVSSVFCCEEPFLSSLVFLSSFFLYLVFPPPPPPLSFSFFRLELEPFDDNSSPPLTEEETEGDLDLKD